MCQKYKTLYLTDSIEYWPYHSATKGEKIMKVLMKSLFMILHAGFILFVEAYCLATVCFDPFQLAENIAFIVIFFGGMAAYLCLLGIAENFYIIDSMLSRLFLISNFIVPVGFIVFLSTAVNYPSVGMAIFTIGIQIVILSASLITHVHLNRRRRSAHTDT